MQAPLKSEQPMFPDLDTDLPKMPVRLQALAILSLFCAQVQFGLLRGYNDWDAELQEGEACFSMLQYFRQPAFPAETSGAPVTQQYILHGLL